jgi:hypothetical protein
MVCVHRLILNGWAATRTQATALGAGLVDAGVLYHVTKEHAFKDEYLFFRFKVWGGVG